MHNLHPKHVTEAVSIGAPGRPTLRVLHVLHSISPACGGPVESLWFLLKAAQMAGIETAVVTTNFDGPGRRSEVPFGRFVDVKGFKVRYFRCQREFYAPSLPMLNWLQRHVRDFDLVHIHALFSFAPVIAAACARFRSVPYIVSPHGVLNRWGRENARPRLKRVSIRYVEGPLLRHAASVQFTSRQELEEFSQLGIAVPTAVIPLALAAPSDSSANFPCKTAAADFSDLTGRPAILFLARIHPIKNLDALLRAFAGVIERFPNAVLLVAGDGDATHVGGLRQLATSLLIDAHIRWLGFANSDLKRKLFERADLFVLPSWSENFGLAAAEAMAAGIPVVVTRGAGIADIVASSECGLVCDSSAPALRTAMEALLADRDTRARMGNAGKRAVLGELSMHRYAQRILELYHSATPELHAGRPIK